MTFPLPVDHFIVDPKYILDKDAEHIYAQTIEEKFEEHKPLEFEMQLTPGVTSKVVTFRTYAGPQTYIFSKEGLYFKALPCDSSFLILIPHETAKTLPRFDADLGVVLPANPEGFKIEKSKLFSGIYAIK